MSVEKMAMPQLGESVTEGTISQWLVAAGDSVNKYDPIAEVTSDKVNAEIPSTFSGVIKELLADEGDTLPVGKPICSIEIEGAQSVVRKPEPSTADGQAADNHSDHDTSMKKRYSPAVLRLAQEHQLDLEKITGSGKYGRITRKDVEGYLAHIPTQAAEKAVTRKAAADHLSMAAQLETAEPAVNRTTAPQNEAGDHIVALTGVRRAIASNLLRSKHEIPHAWTMIEVDVTNLVNYRNQLKNNFLKKEGHKLTYLPFFIKAIVAALKEYPRINSTWAGDRIIEKGSVNISLAVAAEDALYVPVIKHADEQSIKGLALSVDELAAKVRENRLSPEDMQGGTFTVNNTGSFGSIQSQPIINYPQAAILSIESIVKRPVVINNMIAIRDMVNLCMSIDHRVLDGLITGKFLARVKGLLESINSENTPIY